MLLLAGLAEGYLRLFPPKDFHAYLGEASPLQGCYVADADFGATYSSWEALKAENEQRLSEFGPFQGQSDRQPVWAFFGNSFVQGPGMLADTARAAVSDRRIFNLGKHEYLFVRCAQIKLLLEHGLTPERIFLILMPLDTLSIGQQPLDTFRITSRGALTYEPRPPSRPAAWLVAHSQLARTAWFRTGRHRGNPDFRARNLNHGIEPVLLDDLCHLFGNLARVTREHDVPVTVVFIPTYEQITKGTPGGFQDTLTPRLRELGYDVLDTRATFRGHPDHAALFLPDKHFTPAGNHLLMGEVLGHVEAHKVLVRSPGQGRVP